jgi:glutamine synthetase
LIRVGHFLRGGGFMVGMAEYIWMDGARPTQTLRAKTRVVNFKKPIDQVTEKDFPVWSFDGSSTYQATGHDSDLFLQPIRIVKDPIRGGESDFLVLCEVLNPDSTPHTSNTRAKLREVLEKGGKDYEPWIGLEQEYTLFDGLKPLGWPENGYPAPQGPFYCGVGSDEVFGRPLVEHHAAACARAGIMIYGINAEVMPGQWEYQVGPRGFEGDSPDPLTVCDHNWLARYMLYRIGEDYGINAKLHPKPVKGDWNGAGQHTNFSTKDMRDPAKGMKAIEEAIAKLSKTHMAHIAEYGHGLEERLTGHHETAPIDKFSHGHSNRGASIRIPLNVAKDGFGYLEDRRPGANADPYRVATILIKTICDI